MRFEFDFDAREYRRAFRRSIWHGRHWGWGLSLLLMVAGTVWFAVLIVRAFIGDGLAPVMSFLPWGVLCMLWLIATLGWLPFSASRMHRRHFPGRQVTEFTEDYLKTQSSSGTSERKWSAFTRVFETGECFLIHAGRDAAYYLPKRAVGGEPELAEARRFLREKFGANAVLRGGDDSTK